MSLSIKLGLSATALLLAVSSLAASGEPSAVKNSERPGYCRTNWLLEGKVGLSTHYFAHRSNDKDSIADAFHVERVAEQAAEAGVSWMLFTVHHQPWIMMAPNKTYDKILGNGNYTAHRDVPQALYSSLQTHNIKLMLYVNLRLDPKSAAPEAVRLAMGGWPPNDKVISNIAAVYRELSLRYGSKVEGWWVDGAGLEEYRKSPQRERWFGIIADALRSGNPSALVSFNPGIIQKRYTDNDDFTAGESLSIERKPIGRWLDGAQWHMWTYLGPMWGSGGTRFSNEELCQFVSDISSRGGAVTFEVGTRGVNWAQSTDGGRFVRLPGSDAGYIDSKQVSQLKAIVKCGRPTSDVELKNCIN